MDKDPNHEDNWDGDKNLKKVSSEQLDRLNKTKTKLIKQFGEDFYQLKKLEINKCKKCGYLNFYFEEDCSNCDEYIGDKIQEDYVNFKLEHKTKEQELIIKLDNYVDNVKYFHKHIPFFYDRSCVFWLWNKHLNKYEIVDDIDIMNLIDTHLGLQGQTIKSSQKNNYLEAFKRVGRKNIPKDAPKKWVQFKDKAYSINSNNIYEVTPDYFFTNPIPWDLGDTDETKIFDKLFEEWVGEKYVQTLYEIIAYSCYTDYPIQVLFCLHGSGRNGKSTFLKILSKFIGMDNICSTELDLLVGSSSSRFESFKLYKKSVCLMGETNFGVLDKSSLLKKLTGGDLIGFEMKGKKPFDDYSYAKMIIASNSLPTTDDTSEGFYRRWVIIDFPNQFPEGKDITVDIPDSEYSNLAKKCCKILKKLINKGEFTNQGTIEDRKYKYIMASNPLPLFIKDKCVKDDFAYISYNELYTAYVQYLIHNKKRRVSRKEFKISLEDEGFWLQKTSKSIKMKDGTTDYKSDHWIEGIKLCDNCDNYDKVSNSLSPMSYQMRNTSQKSQLSQKKAYKTKTNIDLSITDIVINILHNFGAKEKNIIIDKLYQKIEPKVADPILEELKQKGELIEPVAGYLRLT